MMWQLVQMNRHTRFDKIMSQFKVGKQEYPQIKESVTKLLELCLKNDALIQECRRLLSNHAKHANTCETLMDLAHSS